MLEIAVEEERIRRLQSRMRNDGEEGAKEILARKTSETVTSALAAGLIREGSARVSGIQQLEEKLNGNFKARTSAVYMENRPSVTNVPPSPHYGKVEPQARTSDLYKQNHTSEAEQTEAKEKPEQNLTDEEKRKDAINRMNSALEKITIHQFLEFRKMEKPPELVVDVILAVMCIITRIDETVDAPVSSWPDARKIFHKPGHFVNSLRRFPYAVDSGRVGEKNRKDLPELESFSEDDLEKKSGLALSLLRWLIGAVDYYDFSPKVSPVSQVPQVPQAKAPPTTNSPKDVKPKRPSTAEPKSQQRQQQQQRPATASATPKKKPGTWKNPHEGAPGTATGSNLRSSATKSVASKNLGMRHSASAAGFGLSSPAGKAKLNMRMDETQQLVEQTRREVRELKSLEKKSKWNMERQEKRASQERANKEEEDLRRWRAQEAIETKNYVEQRESEILQTELLESKEFQNFKREVKAIRREEEARYIQEEYQNAKSNSKWEKDIKKTIQQERTELVRERIETYIEGRTQRNLKNELERVEQSDARALERQQEMQMLQRTLAQEKESLLQNLKFVHDRQNVAV